MNVDVKVTSDRSALAAAMAGEVGRIADDSIRARGVFRIALAGGSTPRETYERLGATGAPAAVDAPRWHVFFGDERMVEKDHADSNFAMASRAWLERSAIPQENVHRVPTEAGDAGDVAAAYEAEMRRAFGDLGGRRWPTFDLMLLGMGADGHTASLFPQSPALTESTRWVTSANAATSSSPRITLTLPVLNAARHVRFLVAGADKASTLSKAIKEWGSPDGLPAARVQPKDGTVAVFADAAAASRLGGRATMARAMEPARSSSTADGDDDASLLDGLRRGDATAYERLVRVHGPRLLAVIRRLVANEDDARDVLQETFVSAWKAIQSFHGDSRLSTWLHRIAVNAALMRLRAKKARPERPIDDLLPRFAEDGHHVQDPVAWDGRADTRLEDRETLTRVRAAIESLPETYRTVLVLRDVEGLSTEDTASILNVTANAVKVRLHRAHLALRTLLDPHFRAPSDRDGRRGISSRGRPLK